MTKDTPQPLLVFIRGLPGSGKSYLTERLAAALPDDEVIVLDPDAIDYQSSAYDAHVKTQTSEGVDEKLHPYRFLRAQAYKAIEDGKIILWNQPFNNLELFHKVVARLQEYAGEHGKDLSTLVIEVTIDISTAKKRVETRKANGGHGPSDVIFGQFVDNYVSFANEGFMTIAVDGSGDVNKSVADAKDAISSLRLSFL